MTDPRDKLGGLAPVDQGWPHCRHCDEDGYRDCPQWHQHPCPKSQMA